jgi:hypothetical protein
MPLSSPATGSVTKIILFARARSNRVAFQRWFLDEVVTGLAEDRTGIHRLTVNLVDDPPATPIYRPPSDRDAAAGAMPAPFYDLVVQLWLDGTDSFRRLETGAMSELAERAALLHAYRVTEAVIWDRQEVTPGTQTPGISFMGRLQFHDDMPDSAARRSWTLHTALARKVHVAATRYIQNWIEEPFGADTPPARGIPELHFATEQDLLERFFDSPRGREEVLQDTAHFIQDGPRLYTREFIVLA